MTPIGPGGGAEAPFSHDGGDAGQAPVVDPGDPRPDRGHARVLVIATGSRRAALVNFLGIYWLFSAVLTIARALWTRVEARLPAGPLAGMVGLVAGLLVLGRHVLEPVVSAGSCSMRLVSRRS